MELRPEDLKAMSELNKLFKDLTIDENTIKDNKYGIDVDSLINDHNAGVAGFISSVNCTVIIALLIEKGIITGEEYAESVKTIMNEDNESFKVIKQSRDMILSLLADDDNFKDTSFNGLFDGFEEV